ncbi:MAG: acyltransferase [Hyphomicrobiales bacterium]|nr:acyltransferase [Hyphomicrobiales bacterium]
MRDTAPAKKASDRIEFANSLRGIAAVSVVVAHLFEGFWVGQPVVGLLTGMPTLTIDPPWFARAFTRVPISFASFGVALFFVISGFVIAFSLVRYDARAFLAGRLLRIYPTYWVGFSISVCAVLAGCALAGGVLPFTAVQAGVHYFPPLRAILYSKPIDGIIWTLEIELFFYLLCALIAPAISRGSAKVAGVPFAVFALWIPVYAFAGHPPAGFEKIAARLEFLAVYMPFLIFMFTGVALNFRQRGLIGRVGAVLWVCACVAMFLLAWATKLLGPGWKPLFVGVIEPESYLAALTLFVLAMAGQGAKAGAGALRPFAALLRWTADISYPLYVVHGLAGFVLLHLLVSRGLGPGAALGLTLVVVFLAAWLIHAFVEAPTHRIGQRLARKISVRDLQKTAPTS